MKRYDLDVDVLSEGFEGMRRHRRFLAAERRRLLAIADTIDRHIAELLAQMEAEQCNA